MFCRPFPLQRETLVLLVLARLAVPLAAGEIISVGSAEQLYRVTRWTAENGLPQNSVKALVQTRDGYLWIGTLNGLARFDGVRFKVFDHGNTPEMKHDAIDALAEDAKDGSLWMGTRDALLCYRDGRFHGYGADHGIHGTVGVLQASRFGGVWFSPREGQVALMRDGLVRTWKIAEDPRIEVEQISEESASELFVLLNYRVHQLDLNTGSVTRLVLPSDKVGYRSFLEEPDGTMWLCSGTGIWQEKNGHWNQVTTAGPGLSPVPDRIYRTGDGQLWVTQRERDRVSLQRLLDGRLQPFSAPELPSDIDVTRFLEDREGNLWAGSTRGLFRLQPHRLKVHSQRDGLSDDDTLAVTEGRDGTVWIGTRGGVSAVRHGEVSNLLQRGDQPDPALQRCDTFVVDSQNRLWTGYAAIDVMVFNNNEWQAPWSRHNLHKHGGPQNLYQDRENRFWVGTKNGVLCGIGDQWTHYSTTNGLSHGDVRVIYQDRRGDIWIGTFGGGLNRLRDGKITSYTTTRGAHNNRAWWIHEDADGVFWVGSEDGLNRFVPPGVAADVRRLTSSTRNPNAESQNDRSLLTSAATAERFFTFTTEQGLREKVINNIQEDEFGFLWLSGLRGIYRISRQELNEVAKGQRGQVQVLALGEADGMLSSECNGGDNQPAGCKDHEGRIWFPTTKGVVVIDPKEIRRNELEPPVVIEQVMANDEVVYGDASLTENPKSEIRNPKLHLAPGHARVLTIRYTANSFVAPERVLFKYRLDGYDHDWRRDHENQRVAFYTNLRPGNYTFHVKACNNHGVWNEAGTQLAFYVAPHFWQTWTFYVVSAVGTLLLAVWLAVLVENYRLRWQRQLLKSEERQALADERTRIARDLHDDLGTSLTGLALELDVIRRETQGAPPANERLGETAKRTRNLAERMREVVWAINPRCDNVQSLASFLEQETAQFLRSDRLRGRFEFPDDIPALPLGSQARHQLALSVREALANVVRHAQASEVIVSLKIQERILVVEVRDNGRGFRVDELHEGGHGLASVRERLERIGGSAEWSSTPNRGTTVRFRVPLKELAASIGADHT